MSGGLDETLFLTNLLKRLVLVFGSHDEAVDS